MTDLEIDNYLKTEFKTECCGVAYVKKGRANLRCSKCDKDVTLMVVLLYKELKAR